MSVIMSPKNKLPANKNYQQKSKLNKITRPKDFTKITSTTKEQDLISTILNRELLVGLLFLVGSILFLCDGLIELADGISIRVSLHLSASLMFVIGSYLFIPTDKNN